jgi:hypothetical protein
MSRGVRWAEGLDEPTFLSARHHMHTPLFSIPHAHTHVQWDHPSTNITHQAHLPPLLNPGHHEGQEMLASSLRDQGTCLCLYDCYVLSCAGYTCSHVQVTRALMCRLHVLACAGSMCGNMPGFRMHIHTIHIWAYLTDKALEERRYLIYTYSTHAHTHTRTYMQLKYSTFTKPWENKMPEPPDKYVPTPTWWPTGPPAIILYARKLLHTAAHLMHIIYYSIQNKLVSASTTTLLLMPMHIYLLINKMIWV